MTLLVKFLTAVLLLAIAAVIVSQSSATAGLIQSISSAFSKLTGVVVAPVGSNQNH